MKLKNVTSLTDIKQGDTIILTGDVYNAEPLKVEMVKVSDNDGTEIIFNKKKNQYFNLGMYLEGKSWVKDLAIIEK